MQKCLFLTCYWIWPWHKVKRNRLHWLGQDRLQVPFGDLVQAVGWGRHVLIHAIQAGVHAGLLGLPGFQVSSRSKLFTALPSILCAFHIFWVACQSSLKEEITNKMTNKERIARIHAAIHEVVQRKCQNWCSSYFPHAHKSEMEFSLMILLLLTTSKRTFRL